MSVERQHGNVAIYCDNCGDVGDTDGAEGACPAFWDAYIEGLKANGWTFKRTHTSTWAHYCPDCKE